MIDKKFDEFWELIDLLNKAEALEHLIVIGSWAEYIYEEANLINNFKAELKTRDINLMIKNKNKPRKAIDLISIFKEAGYTVDRNILTDKTQILTTDRLEIEFLLTKVGPGLESTMKTNLGVTAETLRDIKILKDNTIRVPVRGYIIIVPIPEAYVLQKILINKERKNKIEKDRKAINNLLQYLSIDILKSIYNGMTKKQKKIIGIYNSEVETLSFLE